MTRSVHMFTAVAFIALLTAPAATSFDFTALEESVKEHTLDNGMKFIVLERHQAPVVSFVILANVGAVDDPKEYTGLAHMFEHMAFKGTTSLGSKDIEREQQLMAVEDSLYMALRSERKKGRLADSARVAALARDFEAARKDAYELIVPNAYQEVLRREGAVGVNAGTSVDRTVYFYSLPSNKVELWMAMDSERFLNPVLREMYKERDVIAEERRRSVETSPSGRLYEELLGMAFKAHPYGIRGIGHMSDIQNFSREAAMAFFQKYYGPANLVAAIVGDVKAEEVFALAEKYWGRIPYRPRPELIATVEPEQLGERRMVMEDRSQPIFSAAWHIPEITHPDRPAIDAMLDYLGGGRTSLLYKSLVKEKKIASSVSIYPGGAGDKYPTLIIAEATPSAGHNNAECEEAMYAEIEKMKTDLVPETEMVKIKARAKSSFINGLANNSGLASQLASYQNFYDDWREMFRELDRINAVTPQDIQRVANRYFTRKNRTVVAIETQPS
ncbi:MAG: pitrilysin family protein [candidate division Zixibacteria bacterium]|nr:pitrilysin family protein [candidate division Zixibacteria bacterium]